MMPMGHFQGHRGILVVHSVFDGELFLFLARRVKQQWFLEVIKLASRVRTAGGDPEMLFLKQWHVATCCVAHVCHNALKWSMREVYPEYFHMDDIWQVVVGFKNGSNLIHGAMAQWVASHVASLDPMLLPMPEEA